MEIEVPLSPSPVRHKADHIFYLAYKKIIFNEGIAMFFNVLKSVVFVVLIPINFLQF